MGMPRWPKQFLIFCLIPLVQAYHVFNTNCSVPSTLSNYVSSPNTRGTLDILWSSLFTIIACTWTLQHPNVPEQREGRDAGLLGDIKWGLKGFYRGTLRMLCTIIAPELIMMAASENWVVARDNCRGMQQYALEDGVAWSLTHSYFANMGGFVIRGKPTKKQKHHNPYHLNGECIRLLRQKGYIAKLPDMTEEEIKDKSKGDILVKLVALGQIVWSTIQIIARAIKRLPVSPLEVAVVAFAVSGIFIYGLYWNKPQRVGIAQTIQLESANIPDGEAMSDERAILNDVVTSEAITVDEGFISEERAIPAEVYKILKSNKSGRIFKALSNLIFEKKNLPGAPISVDSADFEGRFVLTAGAVGAGAAVFGAIHAIAWNFAFRTTIELILWRCASIYTAAAPLCTMLITYMYEKLDVDHSFVNGLLIAVYILSAFLYVIARLFIIVEMFRTLCFLPPGSYVSTWTSNIPHVG